MDDKSWAARAREYSMYGFTDMPSVEDRGTIVLTRGEGPYVFDTQGRKWLDSNSGLWNMVAGFDHPGLIEAAKAQYDRFPGYHAFFGRMSDQTVMLSEKLVEVSPFRRGKVFYTNSGSEANDTMVKMLWFLHASEGNPQRRKILTRWNAYHGVTAISASMTGKPYNEVFGLPLDGFIHLTCPHFWRYGEAGESEAEFVARLARELEDTIQREGADTIAGFFAEPVQGAGGVIPPAKGYFQAMQPILKKHGIPFIADEVITGFGRTGNTWGCQTYDFVPDAIISSKNLTAGFFPMGAVILGPELSDRLDAAITPIEEFPHGFTASGHPVGCAAGIAALAETRRLKLDENAAARGKDLAQALAALKAKHALVGDVRGKGLMAALELVADRDSKKPADKKTMAKVAGAAYEAGVMLRVSGNNLILSPPLILTSLDVKAIADGIDAGLSAAG